MIGSAVRLFAPLLVLLPAAAFADSAIRNAETGTPKITAIDVIRFAPDGTLLIGDGKGAQLVAVETGDAKATKWETGRVDKIDEKLAGKLGTTAKGIVILHLAVNPKSQIAFFAVRKQDDKKTLLLTLNG